MDFVHLDRYESLSQRAQRLMGEAREAASGQVTLLEEALNSVHLLSSAVAEGGEVYPIGVRDLSRKLSEDAAWCSQTLTTIMKNTGCRKPTLEAEPVPSPVEAEERTQAEPLEEDEPPYPRAIGSGASPRT